ncbi:MAG TPA: hypothetical protein VEU96_14200 [Bryobacteraceae bacterium]|nr:hypothetical protein [Bryobacteraceae bacterium]
MLGSRLGCLLQRSRQVEGDGNRQAAEGGLLGLLERAAGFDVVAGANMQGDPLGNLLFNENGTL